jgi:hypothetical protein
MNFLSKQTLTVQAFLGFLAARNFSDWRARLIATYIAVITITIAVSDWKDFVSHAASTRRSELK